MTWAQVKKNYSNTIRAYLYLRKAHKHLRIALRYLKKDRDISIAHSKLAEAYDKRATEIDPIRGG